MHSKLCRALCSQPPFNGGNLHIERSWGLFRRCATPGVCLSSLGFKLDSRVEIHHLEPCASLCDPVTHLQRERSSSVQGQSVLHGFHRRPKEGAVRKATRAANTGKLHRLQISMRVCVCMEITETHSRSLPAIRQNWSHTCSTLYLALSNARHVA